MKNIFLLMLSVFSINLFGTGIANAFCPDCQNQRPVYKRYYVPQQHRTHTLRQTNHDRVRGIHRQ